MSLKVFFRLFRSYLKDVESEPQGKDKFIRSDEAPMAEWGKHDEGGV